MFEFDNNRLVEIINGKYLPCATYIGKKCHDGIIYDIWEDTEKNLYGVLARV